MRENDQEETYKNLDKFIEFFFSGMTDDLVDDWVDGKIKFTDEDLIKERIEKFNKKFLKEREHDVAPDENVRRQSKEKSP